MKLEQSELATLERLVNKINEVPNDYWSKESLDQYMKDLSYKYKIDFSDYTLNMETGELIYSRRQT